MSSPFALSSESGLFDILDKIENDATRRIAFTGRFQDSHEEVTASFQGLHQTLQTEVDALQTQVKASQREAGPCFQGLYDRLQKEVDKVQAQVPVVQTARPVVAQQVQLSEKQLKKQLKAQKQAEKKAMKRASRLQKKALRMAKKMARGLKL